MIMRWVLALLVILNMGYFFYHVGQDRSVNNKEELMGESSIESSASIQLLSEAIASGAAIRAEPLNNKDGAAGFVQQKLLCTQIGAFDDRDIAEQVQQRLMAASIRSESVEVSVHVSSEFWIYIPPLANRAMAIHKLKELQANGVDSFVITDGDLVNGISLGLFSRKGLAENLLTKRRAAGYDARMKEKKRFRQELWVRVLPEDRELLSNELWDSIHSSYGFAERMDNLCDSTVARSGEFQ